MDLSKSKSEISEIRRGGRFKLWLALVLAATTVVLGAFVAQVHQDRAEANYPQLLIAQSAVQALHDGRSVGEIVGEAPLDATQPPIDIATNQEPFLAVYDQQHNLLGSGARYKGGTVSPPDGTFDYARTHSPHTFTWEPVRGLRLAAVLTYDQNVGYVLSARSLHQTEQNQYWLLVISTLTLAVLVAASAAAARLLR